MGLKMGRLGTREVWGENEERVGREVYSYGLVPKVSMFVRKCGWG